ncbi:MAG: hypothetical protein QOJ26_873, partial [Thermoplasmata archaeon]|nr:hypothetical protein [Thermoplasmata archaeon]
TSDTISSHAVFDGQRALSIRAFASTDTVARAPREHYIFRDEAIDYGFSVVTTQASYQRRADFVPFPTPPQLAFLERVDRIGDFGTLTLGRW